VSGKWLFEKELVDRWVRERTVKLEIERVVLGTIEGVPTGALVAQLTSGAWPVERILGVDEEGGWVYFSADASLGRQDAPYEARFRISIDNKLGDPNIDRWVNVYNDTGDGTDKSVALTVRRPIKAGTHTFYFLAQRHSGTGVVQVYDPMLTVIAPGARIYLPPVRKAY
jgi:hypothetical protein